ncbi:MAG: histidine phosphatase family protein [Rubrivivax sp.]
MDLILWRHAEAVDLSDGGDDLQRGLTAKGERQAAGMAQWLQRHLPAGTRLLVSPARRAQQTARALERTFCTVEGLAPAADVAALLAAARWPDAPEPVLAVGHQPTLGRVAAQLLCGRSQPWALRKGAIVWLRGRARDGEVQVVLHAALGPEQV